MQPKLDNLTMLNRYAFPRRSVGTRISSILLVLCNEAMCDFPEERRHS